MKVFGIIGWSGSGKTTLMVKLLPELIRRGYKVSTMKHINHGFDIDRKGKDSYEHRKAGATEVMISSSNRWALMHELRGAEEPALDKLIKHMIPVDLLLIEGFQNHRYDKLEVYRKVTGKPLRCLEDDNIVAIACDSLLGAATIPLVDLNDTVSIADFIEEHCGLRGDSGHESA